MPATRFASLSQINEIWWCNLRYSFNVPDAAKKGQQPS